MIDERDAASRSSIDQKGHYQTDLAGADGKTAEIMPHGNLCYACHGARAAVEHTFVQSHPTLKVVAKKFGTSLPQVVIVLSSID